MQEELFSDDIRLSSVARQLQLDKEIEVFKTQIEQILTPEELKGLANILAKRPMLEVAECGNRIMSLLQYYNK